MIMYDQDPDILRWGLNILHVEPFSSSAYCGTATQDDAQFYDGGYTREGNFGTDHTCVESDEIIAHALQEEFSQLAVAEATDHSHASVEHSQAAVLSQDWFIPSMTSFYSGNEGGQEEADNMESSSSCSSPGEISYEWEALELYDEYSTLDGEVGKRLNHMVSIPHVPKINGEIPSIDEATSDHQRLLDRYSFQFVSNYYEEVSILTTYANLLSCCEEQRNPLCQIWPIFWVGRMYPFFFFSVVLS